MGYEIGPRLRKYREEKDLSQKEFAKRIGVSNSRVSNWEKGINRPDVDILSRICEILEVSPSELLDVRLSEEDLNDQEKKLIVQYRKKPHLQLAVNILLGIGDDASSYGQEDDLSGK